MRYRHQLNSWCCKPRYVYWAINPAGGGLHRNTVVATNDWTAGDLPYAYEGALKEGVTTVPSVTKEAALAFDRVNEQLFFSNHLDSGNIYKVNQDPRSEPVFILDPGLSLTLLLLVMDCDPTNERIFYMLVSDSPTWSIEIRVVNYDGTGDASVVTHTGTIHSFGVHGGYDLKYNLNDDMIYYTHNDDTKNGVIRKVAPNGTGNTIIRGPGPLDYSNNDTDMGGIAIDAVNQYVFWGESSSGGTYRGNILRATTSGGSLTNLGTVKGRATNYPPYFCYSNLFAWLHVWEWDGLVGTGKIHKMRNDGTSDTTLWDDATDPPLFWNAGNAKFWLGRGLESVGAGITL